MTRSIDGDTLFFIALGVVLAILIGFLAYLYHEEKSYYLQMMAQCMNDGHKEYECVGMLGSHRGDNYILIAK